MDGKMQPACYGLTDKVKEAMNKKIRTEWEMTDGCRKESSGFCKEMPDCGPYHITALGAAWAMNVLITLEGDANPA